jgi:sirohydrochlorin cobaltochelatase
VTLVLAAHGSDHDVRCAAPVHRHADAIARRGMFRDVKAVFWKEPPFFNDIDALAQGDVVVVPMMAAGGYYASTVLPREMRLHEPERAARIRVGRAIGEFDEIGDVIVDQALAAAELGGVEPSSANVLLIGHGTRRDPERSGATTHRHAQQIASRGIFASVHAAFLEQDPTIPQSFASISGQGPVIVVPFLIASGGHGADDIPMALGAKAGASCACVGGREVRFAEAVGESEAIPEIVLWSAAEASSARGAS